MKNYLDFITNTDSFWKTVFSGYNPGKGIDQSKFLSVFNASLKPEYANTEKLKQRNLDSFLGYLKQEGHIFSMKKPKNHFTLSSKIIDKIRNNGLNLYDIVPNDTLETEKIQILCKERELYISAIRVAMVYEKLGNTERINRQTFDSLLEKVGFTAPYEIRMSEFDQLSTLLGLPEIDRKIGRKGGSKWTNGVLCMLVRLWPVIFKEEFPDTEIKSIHDYLLGNPVSFKNIKEYQQEPEPETPQKEVPDPELPFHLSFPAYLATITRNAIPEIMKGEFLSVPERLFYKNELERAVPNVQGKMKMLDFNNIMDAYFNHPKRSISRNLKSIKAEERDKLVLISCYPKGTKEVILKNLKTILSDLKEIEPYKSSINWNTLFSYVRSNPQNDHHTPQVSINIVGEVDLDENGNVVTPQAQETVTIESKDTGETFSVFLDEEESMEVVDPNPEVQEPKEEVTEEISTPEEPQQQIEEEKEPEVIQVINPKSIPNYIKALIIEGAICAGKLSFADISKHITKHRGKILPPNFGDIFQDFCSNLGINIVDFRDSVTITDDLKKILLDDIYNPKSKDVIIHVLPLPGLNVQSWFGTFIPEPHCSSIMTSKSKFGRTTIITDHTIVGQTVISKILENKDVLFEVINIDESEFVDYINQNREKRFISFEESLNSIMNKL